jgi:phage terminase large subunit GpA-like protein
MVPDGPRSGEAWDPLLTPYVIEPLEFLAPDSGVNELAAMKSAQSGFTTLLIAAIGDSADRFRAVRFQPRQAAGRH